MLPVVSKSLVFTMNVRPARTSCVPMAGAGVPLETLVVMVNTRSFFSGSVAVTMRPSVADTGYDSDRSDQHQQIDNIDDAEQLALFVNDLHKFPPLANEFRVSLCHYTIERLKS